MEKLGCKASKEGLKHDSEITEEIFDTVFGAGLPWLNTVSFNACQKERTAGSNE